MTNSQPDAVKTQVPRPVRDIHAALDQLGAHFQKLGWRTSAQFGHETNVLTLSYHGLTIVVRIQPSSQIATTVNGQIRSQTIAEPYAAVIHFSPGGRYPTAQSIIGLPAGITPIADAIIKDIGNNASLQQG